MAIKIGDFVGIVKRESRYGTSSVLTDQPTLDILNEVNVRATRIWGAADWKWTRETLQISLVSGTSDYVVDTVSGNLIDRILNIIPLDLTAAPPVQGKPLVELTERQFFEQCDMRPGYSAGSPEKYYNRGLDSNGKWGITVWPVPNTAFKLTGSAKPILSLYTLADIVANNPIRYFPNSVVVDVLLDGVMSGIKGIMGDDAEKARLDVQFENKLQKFIAEQIGVATDSTPPTSDLPDYLTRRRAGRRYKRSMVG